MYMWNVMLGLGVGVGGRGFGVDRDEHASTNTHKHMISYERNYPINILRFISFKVLSQTRFSTSFHKIKSRNNLAHALFDSLTGL